MSESIDKFSKWIFIILSAKFWLASFKNYQRSNFPLKLFNCLVLTLFIPVLRKTDETSKAIDNIKTTTAVTCVAINDKHKIYFKPAPQQLTDSSLFIFMNIICSYKIGSAARPPPSLCCYRLFLKLWSRNPRRSKPTAWCTK